MRIGLAGVGRIGAFHAQTLSEIEEIDSLVLTDADLPRARAAAETLGATAVTSTDELFRAGLDGVVIATGTHAHAALLTAAVRAGIPVFCEKPVAPDVDGTLAVIRAVADSDVPAQIGFQRRFDSGYSTAREAVLDGALGWVHTYRAHTLDPVPPPAAYIPTSGGIFRDCSVHDFDILRWVSGCEVVEVYAAGANRGADFFADAGDIATAAALLTLSDGSFASVSSSRYNGRGYDVRLEALGSADSICVGLDDRLPLGSVEPGVDFPQATPYASFMERFGPAYVKELTAFVGVVAGREKVSCGVQDALEAFYIAEACEVSRARHAPVELAEVRR